MCDGSGNYSVLISHVVSIRTEDSFPLYIQLEKNDYLYSELKSGFFCQNILDKQYYMGVHIGVVKI